MAVKMFFSDSQQQMSSLITMMLHKATSRFLIRLTGGSNHMDIESGNRCVSVLSQALNGFTGVVLFGGTRTVKLEDPNYVYPTISEVACHIKHSEGLRIFGVIPRMRVIEYDHPQYGLVIDRNFADGLVTILHPLQHVCLQVQRNVDDFVPWDAEWKECVRVTQSFVTHGGWKSVLIVYNGGPTTVREVNYWAERDLPILLVKGSGRAADQFANDQAWLADHPSVHLVGNQTKLIRKALRDLGAFEKDNLK